jgi:hypothetical protein
MSEYQYYEFQAIDRPLSAQEMRELRSYSTRAQITPTSFINEYHWGAFKGDEDDWMERYYDAFLYFANWGTHILKLRVPTTILSTSEVRPYRSTQSFSIRTTGDWTILSFVSSDQDVDWPDGDEEDKPWEDEYDDEWEDDDLYDGSDGKGVLSSLISIRSEIAHGDHRALYLGWLLAVQMGEIEPGTKEPPVPPGLTHLSAAQQTLVSFLRIDRNLVEVAAENSAPMPNAVLPDEAQCLAWLANVPMVEKDVWLARLMRENALSVSTEIQRRFQRDYSPKNTDRAAPISRTAKELIDRAAKREEERARIAKEEAAARKAQALQERAREREKYLDTLAGRENEIWTNLEKLVARKHPSNYDSAVMILVDLRDLAARTGNTDFIRRLEAFRTAHTRKPSLLERIRKANL